MEERRKKIFRRNGMVGGICGIFLFKVCDQRRCLLPSERLLVSVMTLFE